MTRKPALKPKAVASLKPKSVSPLRAASRRSEIASKAGRVSGDARTERVTTSVQKAMEALEKEIAAAGGVERLFPKGLTKKAVAERAGINHRSLHTTKLRTLGEAVSTWVDEKNGVATQERAAPASDEEVAPKRSRSLSQRYEDLKVSWETVRQDIRDTKLAMMNMKSELEAARAQCGQLALENAALQSEVEALKGKMANVVRLPRRK